MPWPSSSRGAFRGRGAKCPPGGIYDRPRDNRPRDASYDRQRARQSNPRHQAEPANHPRDWLCRASGPRRIRTATALQTVLPRGFDLARGRRVEPAKREATVLKKSLHNKPYHVSLLRPISPLSCSAAGTREELCGIGSRHAWRRREARTPTHQGAHGARPHLSQGRPRVSSLSLVRYRNNDCSVPTRHGLQEVLAKGYVDRVRDRLSRKFTLGRNVFTRPRPKPESGDRFSHLRNAGIRACGPAVGAGTQIGVRRDNQGENPATMRMRMRRC